MRASHGHMLVAEPRPYFTGSRANDDVLPFACGLWFALGQAKTQPLAP